MGEIVVMQLGLVGYQQLRVQCCGHVKFTCPVTCFLNWMCTWQRRCCCGCCCCCRRRRRFTARRTAPGVDCVVTLLNHWNQIANHVLCLFYFFSFFFHCFTVSSVLPHSILALLFSLSLAATVSRNRLLEFSFLVPLLWLDVLQLTPFYIYSNFIIIFF